MIAEGERRPQTNTSEARLYSENQPQIVDEMLLRGRHRWEKAKTSTKLSLLSIMIGVSALLSNFQDSTVTTLAAAAIICGAVEAGFGIHYYLASKRLGKFETLSSST